jgi:hypothetical protein
MTAVSDTASRRPSVPADALTLGAALGLGVALGSADALGPAVGSAVVAR